MRKRIWAFALSMILVLSGCSSGKQKPSHPVVSQIAVTTETDGTATYKVYTTQAKMRQILDRLRVLGQKFTPFADPDTLTAPIYHIRIDMTDGGYRSYLVKPTCYIRTGQDPWQQADSEQIQKLLHLLQTLPPDAP